MTACMMLRITTGAVDKKEALKVNIIVSVLRVNERGVSIGIREKRAEDADAKRVRIGEDIVLPFTWACDASCIGIEFSGNERELIGKTIEFLQ